MLNSKSRNKASSLNLMFNMVSVGSNKIEKYNATQAILERNLRQFKDFALKGLTTNHQGWHNYVNV